MDIKKSIERYEYNSRKYLYYTGLGYSATSAAVLTLLTYGSDPLSELARSVPKEELFEMLYKLLAESGTGDVKMAIRFFLENGFPYKEEESPKEPAPVQVDDASFERLREEMKAILDILTDRERRVIELRSGLLTDVSTRSRKSAESSASPVSVSVRSRRRRCASCRIRPEDNLREITGSGKSRQSQSLTACLRRKACRTVPLTIRFPIPECQASGPVSVTLLPTVMNRSKKTVRAAFSPLRRPLSG